MAEFADLHIAAFLSPEMEAMLERTYNAYSEGRKSIVASFDAVEATNAYATSKFTLMGATRNGSHVPLTVLELAVMRNKSRLAGRKLEPPPNYTIESLVWFFRNYELRTGRFLRVVFVDEAPGPMRAFIRLFAEAVCRQAQRLVVSESWGNLVRLRDAAVAASAAGAPATAKRAAIAVLRQAPVGLGLFDPEVAAGWDAFKLRDSSIAAHTQAAIADCGRILTNLSAAVKEVVRVAELYATPGDTHPIGLYFCAMKYFNEEWAWQSATTGHFADLLREGTLRALFLCVFHVLQNLLKTLLTRAMVAESHACRRRWLTQHASAALGPQVLGAATVDDEEGTEAGMSPSDEATGPCVSKPLEQRAVDSLVEIYGNLSDGSGDFLSDTTDKRSLIDAIDGLMKVNTAIAGSSSLLTALSAGAEASSAAAAAATTTAATTTAVEEADGDAGDCDAEFGGRADLYNTFASSISGSAVSAVAFSSSGSRSGRPSSSDATSSVRELSATAAPPQAPSRKAARAAAAQIRSSNRPDRHAENARDFHVDIYDVIYATTSDYEAAKARFLEIYAGPIAEKMQKLYFNSAYDLLWAPALRIGVDVRYLSSTGGSEAHHRLMRIVQHSDPNASAINHTGPPSGTPLDRSNSVIGGVWIREAMQASGRYQPAANVSYKRSVAVQSRAAQLLRTCSLPSAHALAAQAGGAAYSSTSSSAVVSASPASSFSASSLCAASAAELEPPQSSDDAHHEALVLSVTERETAASFSLSAPLSAAAAAATAASEVLTSLSFSSSMPSPSSLSMALSSASASSSSRSRRAAAVSRASPSVSVSSNSAPASPLSMGRGGSNRGHSGSLPGVSSLDTTMVEAGDSDDNYQPLLSSSAARLPGTAASAASSSSSSLSSSSSSSSSSPSAAASSLWSLSSSLLAAFPPVTGTAHSSVATMLESQGGRVGSFFSPEPAIQVLDRRLLKFNVEVTFLGGSTTHEVDLRRYTCTCTSSVTPCAPLLATSVYAREVLGVERLPFLCSDPRLIAPQLHVGLPMLVQGVSRKRGPRKHAESVEPAPAKRAGLGDRQGSGEGIHGQSSSKRKSMKPPQQQQQQQHSATSEMRPSLAGTGAIPHATLNLKLGSRKGPSLIAELGAAPVASAAASSVVGVGSSDVFVGGDPAASSSSASLSSAAADACAIPASSIIDSATHASAPASRSPSARGSGRRTSHV